MTPSSSETSTPSTRSRSAQERLMVAVRVRPLNNNETRRVLHVLDDKTLVIEDDSDKSDVLRQKRPGDRQYVYDAVFGEHSSQEEVYVSTARPLVSDVLGGFNATVFAYGATGSGKTHTMVGEQGAPGVMVRALNDLFLALRATDQPDTFQVKMSYMEIYNENIRDLLNPASGYLELREDSRGRNIQVARLSEVSTTSTDEVMALLQKGNKCRMMEPTAANQTSSRSHALLSVTVRQTSPQRSGAARRTVRQGKLFMIDLAGSERASHTKNRGKRLQEGAHINRSLLALGNCINALFGGARYVNYRDSKLTRLLKDALGGNCRTVMVAHVSPSLAHREESRTTLLYAERANNISKKVERNVLSVSFHVSQYRAIIGELREEIGRLHAKMGERPRASSFEEKKGVPPETLARLKSHIVATFGDQMLLRRKLMNLDAQLLSLAAEAESQHLVISTWESHDNKLYKKRPPGTSWELADDRQLLNVNETTDPAVQQAVAELSYIEKETERCMRMREKTERQLEKVRRQGAKLEDELPSQISSEEERELLGLICRVHELEVEKIALQSERLSKQHELRRRDLIILRFDRQRQICEEIITRQRQLMEEGSVALTPDLHELYRLYQNELHASAYKGQSPTLQFAYPYSSHTADKTKDNRLPSINQHEEHLLQRSMRLTGGDHLTRTDSDASLQTPDSSSGDSEECSYSPLPSVTSVPMTTAGRAEQGGAATAPPAAVLFPALPPVYPAGRTPLPHSRGNDTSLPRGDGRGAVRPPRTSHASSVMPLERTVSDDSIASRFDGRKSRHRSRWRN